MPDVFTARHSDPGIPKPRWGVVAQEVLKAGYNKLLSLLKTSWSLTISPAWPRPSITHLEQCSPLLRVSHLHPGPGPTLQVGG